MQVGYGIGSDTSTNTVEHDHSTAWVTYTAGSATVGVQTSSIDKPANDIDRLAAAVSIAVNENMSVSYGERDVEYDSLTNDEESKGVSISYTAGSMTVTAVNNKKDKVGGGAADDEVYELKLIMAF